jgi:hypothetical protein
MLAMVSAMSLWSLRFAPSTVRPTGTPAPSVRRLRLVPSLPRSVGLGPVFFPPEWGLGHRPVQRKPVPVDALRIVVGQKALAPELVEDATVEPLAKSAIRRGAGTDPSCVQGIPLAAGPQHEEDRCHGVAVGNSRTVTSEWMRRTLGQQRLHLGPQSIGQLPTTGGRRGFHGQQQGRETVDCAIFRLIRWAAVPCGHALPK